MDFKDDPRFSDIKPFENRISLSTPTMHNAEEKWINEAIRTNQVSVFGDNIESIEKSVAEYSGSDYAVALSSGTAALHLAVKSAGEKLFGKPKPNEGALKGKKVFCSDLTFGATANPVAYEGGEAVFIDAEYESWNMSPKALEKAFEKYPDVKLVVVAHLYGTPANMQKIKEICQKHGALIVEDAAESFGAKYKLDGEWKKTGALGDYNCISFNANKIITGSMGGMFLTNSFDDAQKVRKWSSQSREQAPWYQHNEIGYNYRMPNTVAGIVRGQLPYLEEHIEKKRMIWQRYEKGFARLPVKMNPLGGDNAEPNFWLSCLTIDPDSMSFQKRSENDYEYKQEAGKTCPQEILDAFASFNVESRPIWKPMHLQPVYKNNVFITADERELSDVGADIFKRGLCLPSDIKMTQQQQDVIIEIIKSFFNNN